MPDDRFTLGAGAVFTSPELEGGFRSTLQYVPNLTGTHISVRTSPDAHLRYPRRKNLVTIFSTNSVWTALLAWAVLGAKPPDRPEVSRLRAPGQQRLSLALGHTDLRPQRLDDDEFFRVYQLAANAASLRDDISLTVLPSGECLPCLPRGGLQSSAIAFAVKGVAFRISSALARVQSVHYLLNHERSGELWLPYFRTASSIFREICESGYSVDFRFPELLNKLICRNSLGGAAPVSEALNSLSDDIDSEALRKASPEVLPGEEV